MQPPCASDLSLFIRGQLGSVKGVLLFKVNMSGKRVI